MPRDGFVSRLSRTLVAVFIAVAPLLIVFAPTAEAVTDPSGLNASLTSTTVGASVGSTVSYISASTWLDTDVVITFTGWMANNTFVHTPGGCDPSVAVATTVSSSLNLCQWAQVGANAVLTMRLHSNGLAGNVAITLTPGMLTNPGTPGSHAVTASEVWYGSVLSQSIQITGPPSAATSSLAPMSASITADGAASQVLTVQAKDASGTSISSDSATVSITRKSGVGSVGSVAYGGNGTYVAAVTSTTAGSGTFIATVDGSEVQSGVGSQTESTITFTAGPAAAVLIDSGDGQSGPVGSLVAVPPRVIVEDANGNPVAGVGVTFVVVSGGGVVNPATEITTGPDGRVAVTSWTLGPIAGSNTLSATATGIGGAPSVTFTALASAVPTPTPAPTPAPAPSSSSSSSAAPTASATAPPTPTASATPTPHPSPSRKPSPSASPSVSSRPSASAAPSAAPSSSRTPSGSASPVVDEATESATPEPSVESAQPLPSETAAVAVAPSDPPAPSPVPEVPGAAPSPSPASMFNDDTILGPTLRLVVNLSLGATVTGRSVTLDAVGLRPGTPVAVLLYSEPRVIGEGVADAQGNSAVQTTVPADLEVGTHTIMAKGTSPDGQSVQAVGAFTIDADQVATAIAPPAQSVMPVAPGSPELERALAAGKPIYDPGLHPATTAAVAVAGIALLGIAGLGGMSSPSSGAGQSGTKTARGKLAGVVTKKLKVVKDEEEGRGDRSRTWRAPLTARTDAVIAAAPIRAGRWSAMVPRVLVDGAWSRAMFGSLGFALWIAGFGLGVWSAASVGFNAFPPALPLALAIIVLGVLDSSAGAVAWLTITTAAAVTGHVTTWADVRTLLGMFVLFASLPLLAHVIRPLRRKASTERKDRFDRFADYVMMPIFVAFAAASMFKALNGLSGLELTSPDQMWAVRIAVILACWLRLGLEDVATHAYPVRSKQVQPEKLVSPGKRMSIVSVVIRTGVFILIAAPFFGLGWLTWLAAILLAIPMLLKIWEDSLPNSPQLNRWYPRGLARFVLLLVVGIYLAAWLLGHSAPDEQVRATYNLLLLPGIVSGVIELFGREGGDWPNTWLKRAAGGLLWLFAASVVVGLIALG